MKRRLFALLLALLLAVPATTRADYIHGFFRYIIQDGSVTITAYTGREEVVTVPSMIGEYPVSTIAAGAFANCPTVTTIYLPDTVMTIEAGAFAPNQWVVYSNGTAGEDPSAPPGVRDENGNLITTDTEGHLVLVDKDGRETVLDDSQTYTVSADGEGNTVIQSESGVVSVEENGRVTFVDGEQHSVTVDLGEGKLGRGEYTEQEPTQAPVPEATPEPTAPATETPKAAETLKATEAPGITEAPAAVKVPETVTSASKTARNWIVGGLGALTAAAVILLVKRKRKS